MKLCVVMVLALMFTACHKENAGANNQLETDEGIYTTYHVYPSTAVVIHDAVTDIDGNHYDAVQIGNQVWMAENLRVTHYPDGSCMDYWGYLAPNNDQNNVSTYGYLYNWDVANQFWYWTHDEDGYPITGGDICPSGWHLPSNEEWEELITTLKDNSQYHCGNCQECIGKALATTTGWRIWNQQTCAIGNNQSVNNYTGFSAPPAGSFYGNIQYDESGNIIIDDRYDMNFGESATFWTSDPGLNENSYDSQTYTYHRTGYKLWCGYTELRRCKDHYEEYHSVRCVRD